jgi:hypothetical protein
VHPNRKTQSQEEQRIIQVLQDRIAAVKAENSMLQAAGE